MAPKQKPKPSTSRPTPAPVPATAVEDLFTSLNKHIETSDFDHAVKVADQGVVYDATLDAKKVAVKKPILSTSQDIDNFHKQLQLLCKLNHQGIAKLVAAHARPPNYMFFFKFYEFGNLSHKLHVEEWTPSLRQALFITRQLASALQYLHSIGILHRDVKPANVLMMTLISKEAIEERGDSTTKQ